MKATIWLGLSGVRQVFEAQLVQAFFDWQLVPSEIKTCAGLIGIRISWMGQDLQSFRELHDFFCLKGMFIS